MKQFTNNRVASVGSQMIIIGSCEFAWPACILGLMNAIVDSHELNFMMLAMLDNRNGGGWKSNRASVTFGGDEL